MGEKIGEWTHNLVDFDGKAREYTDKLNKGYNVENIIRVEYVPATKTFDIYFNGEYEPSFTDSTFTGGKFGFFATVGKEEDENFPSTPVNILFKQHQPKEKLRATSSNPISAYRVNPSFNFASERIINE